MTKKSFALIVLLIGIAINFNSCTKLGDNNATPNLENGKIDKEAAIKELLTNCTDYAAKEGGKKDGYYRNNKIKIEFPGIVNKLTHAKIVGSVIKKVLKPLLEKMNRCAEQSAKNAIPIFKKAIGRMNIYDAASIISGNETAAEYLKDETYNKLKDEYYPEIKKTLKNVGAQQIWETVFSIYNKVPFVDDIHSDLADYVTSKALDGLFVLLAEQEDKVRNNAAEEVSDLVKEVFGKK
ncbi:MAG: DUF4197 domain-containing protein [Bacteroidales bacterium]